MNTLLCNTSDVWLRKNLSMSIDTNKNSLAEQFAHRLNGFVDYVFNYL